MYRYGRTIFLIDPEQTDSNHSRCQYVGFSSGTPSRSLTTRARINRRSERRFR